MYDHRVQPMATAPRAIKSIALNFKAVTLRGTRRESKPREANTIAIESLRRSADASTGNTRAG
jgi:hypothetical protein